MQQRARSLCLVNISHASFFSFFWPGACFLKAPEMFWARKAISNSFYLKKRGVHAWNLLCEENLCPGEGGTPYNGLYGEAPPERGTFFRLQVYKRVGISQV